MSFFANFKAEEIRSTSTKEEEDDKYKIPKDNANSIKEENENLYNEARINKKVIINIKGKKLKVIDIETTYFGEDGIPLKTQEYLELLIGILGKFYNDESALRDIWSNPTNRKDLLNKLKEMNIDEAQLEDLKVIFDAKSSDIYDVLAHLSFNLDIKTRAERVLAVENSEFVEKYHNDKAKEFIEFILNRYKKDLETSFGNCKIRDEYFVLQREIYR